MSRNVGLSSRGAGNVQTTLEKINAAVEERAKKDNDNIDLSTSENWLIREELMEICKKAVNEKLVAKVRKAGPCGPRNSFGDSWPTRSGHDAYCEC